MILLLIEIEFKLDYRIRTTVRAWVKTLDESEALTMADNYLSAEGWKICKLIECVRTEKEDYYEPCSGLENYVRAEKQGVAVLMSDEVCIG